MPTKVSTKLEHVTVHLSDKAKIELQVQISTAISLKRIADFLDSELRYTSNTRNLFDILSENP